jgi:dCMP deaminase
MPKQNRLLKKSKEASVQKHVRPSWDEYFMELARVVALRGTCDRGRASCVIVRGKHPLTMGYAGAPTGMPHCDEVGHQLKKTIHEDGHITEHCVRTIHAEQNAILQAAKLGIAVEGATLYCNMTPCRVCAMLIIGAGIKRVVAAKKYHAGQESEEMFRVAKVKLEYLSEEMEEYPKK